jgi:glutamate-ammonia-ligase adenylyltransferase
LRVARQLVLERLAVLDVEQGAGAGAITGAMTHLAEATLELALAQALADADERHGVPRDASGQRIDFWIVGMGKLGARELNVSSDIDLIYIYEDDGQTDGIRPDRRRGRRSGAPDLGARVLSPVAKRLYALIGDTTEDGFVFRVDLALRPNGNSGPAGGSLGCWRSTSRCRAASGSALPG